MKTILMTAYAINPYKGSEEGTGWNLVCQSARNHKVIAITRKNNSEPIQQYISEHPEMKYLYDNISFHHFDLPLWMIRWKKGPLLSALYFYIWQFCIAFWIKNKKWSFDVAHSVNFHSNWTPSFLWILGKPFVWGPVGNHPLIPKQYILKEYGWKAYLKDRMLWIVKWCFWNLDPFLFICRKKAQAVFCVNTQAAEKLRLPEHKIIFMPAVASEMPLHISEKSYDVFTILSVGRFVPLKGFDITIRSFALFYHNLSVLDQARVKLQIIGTGPEKKHLMNIIKKEKVEEAVEILEWMPRKDVIETFRKSAVYLFPSHEGAGMVVAEALSYGLPVLCLDNYGPGEYVPTSSSLKIQESSYNTTILDFAASLQRLYFDKDLYNKESEMAMEHFKNEFLWDKKGDVFKKVYDNVSRGTGYSLSTGIPKPLFSLNK